MIWRKFPELAEKEDLNARATRDNTIASASGRTITEKYWVDTYGVEFEPKEPVQDPNAPPDLSGAFGPPPGAVPDAAPPPDGATPDATAPPADAAALDAPPALSLAESSTAWTVGNVPAGDIADFARLKMAGNTKQKKNCKKGWSCGYTCLGKDKKNCKSPLQGQVATYADWLQQQISVASVPLIADSFSSALPLLTGSDKQIQWASDIRDDFTSEKTDSNGFDVGPKTWIERIRGNGPESLNEALLANTAYEKALKIQDAKFWIDNRNFLLMPQFKTWYRTSDLIDLSDEILASDQSGFVPRKIRKLRADGTIPPALNLEEQLCKPCTVEHPGDAAESSTPWTVDSVSNLSEPAETPAVETTTQQLTQSAIAQSQQPVEDWFEKVRGLLDGAASLEEVRDRLYDLYKDLPGADFAEAVAQAMQVAELAGRWEVLNPEPVVNLSEDIADFARLKMAGNTKQRKNCTKGWSCGYTCLGKDKKNCKSPLQGQVAKYADWLEQQAVGLSTMGAKPALNLDPQSFEEFISNGRQIVGEEFFAATKDAIAQYKQLDARYESARDGKYYEALVDYQFATPEYGQNLDDREAALSAQGRLNRALALKEIGPDEYKKQYQKLNAQLKTLDVERNALRERLQDEFETTQPELVDIAKERARLDQIGIDFRDRLLKASTVSEAEAKELAAKIKIPRASERRDPKLRGEVATLIRLSNGAAAKTLKEIKIISGRAYSQKSNGLVAVRTGARRALYHEIGHQIEDSQDLFGKTAQSWILSRAEGSARPLILMTNGNYRSDEVALPDKFIDPYVGKVYKRGGTEVVSMGVENFFNPRAMLTLASTDPDHFAYTVGVLQTPRSQ
jgi:hypothetical protein